jgi:hypothetical protein
MEYVFRILKKVTHMERPLRNSEETKKYFVEINDTFETDKKQGNIFKLISATKSEVVLEYDRHYLVKNEHKGYEWTTNLKMNKPKQITSMWGPTQITLTITYLGVEDASSEVPLNNTDTE